MPRNTSPFNHPQGTMVGGVWTPTPFTVASKTALKAIDANSRVAGQIEVRADDFSQWIYNSTSTLTADTPEQLVIVPVDAPAAGRWLRLPGQVAVLDLPITFATADAAVLLTVPTGCKFQILDLHWNITADFTGGSSSAIGVSSAKTGFSTKGDLLGGATGDVLAALTAALSPAGGTIGVGINSLAKLKTALWNAADTIRFDRITSAFTAGAGSVSLKVLLLANAGA